VLLIPGGGGGGKNTVAERLVLFSKPFIFLKCPSMRILTSLFYMNKTYLGRWLIYISKGHGNEADFLGFLQKLVPHRSFTLPFEPFLFWLQIHGDIRNWKTTHWLGESATRRVGKSLTLRLGFWMFKRKLASRRVAMVSQGVAIQICKIFLSL
jgi:hypothetical protein